MAVDRLDGRVVWERTAREEAPHEASHPDNGTGVEFGCNRRATFIAFFESRGIFAYDRKANSSGKRSRRQVDAHQFGEGSTPALHGNYLIVVWNHTAGSYIVALDKRTGNELWRVKRDEIARGQLRSSSSRWPRAGDRPWDEQVDELRPRKGSVVWHSQGLTMNPIPSPVGADGMIYAMSGFRGNNLKAIRLADARAIFPIRVRSSGHSIATHLTCRHQCCRRHPVFSEDEQQHLVGLRCEVGEAALSAPAARRSVRGFLLRLAAAGVSTSQAAKAPLW